MRKFLECIDEYEKRLEKEIMDIVKNESIPLTEKNKMMAPISDRKKLIVATKKELLDIENRIYEAKCEMYRFR